MKVKVTLTKQQILNIPKLTPKKTAKEIATEYGISRDMVWYWIRKLRKKGIKVTTQSRGRKGILDCGISMSKETFFDTLRKHFIID